MISTIILAGNASEASEFARKARLREHAVITQPYHVNRFERKTTTLVLAGTWRSNPMNEQVQDAARARQMPIQTAQEFLRGKA